MNKVYRFNFYTYPRLSDGEEIIEDLYEFENPFKKDGSFIKIIRDRIKEHVEQGKRVEIITVE